MWIAGQVRAVALSRCERGNGTAATNVQRQPEFRTAADWPKTLNPPRLRPGCRSHDAPQRRDEGFAVHRGCIGVTGRREGRRKFRHQTFASDDQAAARGVRQRHLQVLAGPLISWPFPNRTRVGTRIAAAQAESDAYARFDGAVLTALRGTESDLTVYARDLDRVAVLRVASGQSGKAARNGETLFRAGRTGFLPALDAQHTAIGADQTLAAAESRLAPDQVQIFLALSGGWHLIGRAPARRRCRYDPPTFRVPSRPS